MGPKISASKFASQTLPVLLSLAALPAFALTGTVTKVSGNRAIVQFDGPVSKGDVVQGQDSGDVLLDSEAGGTRSGSMKNLKKRENTVSYTAGIMNTSVSGVSTSSVPVAVQYNFVHTDWEWGLIGGVSLTNSYNLTGTGFSGGGIGQYDFVPNRVGVTWMPAVYGKLLYTSSSNGGGVVAGTNNSSISAAAGAVSSSGFMIAAGGVLDYYGFSDRIALTVNLEYLSWNVSLPSTSITVSGFAGGTGFRVSF